MSKDQNLVKKIRQYVFESCQKDTNVYVRAYEDHFISTVKFAKQLAIERQADIEIVEIAAWLHDIASVMGQYEDHHIFGANHAEKLLSDYNYPDNKIQKIKHCIIAHRGSKDIPRETIEAECVADADAMSHFDNIGSLYYLAYTTKNLTPEQANDFIRKKLQRSWDKLTPEGKTFIKNHYKAAMLLIK